MIRSLNPRLTMARLPNWTQIPLTWVTGSALPAQRMPRWRPWHFALSAVTTLGIGLTLSFIVLDTGGAWCCLLLLSWFFTIVGVRSIQLGIVHHCAHGNVAKDRAIGDAIGRALSIVLLLEDYDGYKHFHLVDHHTDMLSTSVDPTRQKLERCGLTLGTPAALLKRRLLRALLNPLHHIDEFGRRLRSHYRTNHLWTQVVMTLWLCALSVATLSHAFVMMMGWWLPLIVGYEVCSLIRSVIRHWPERDGAKGLAVLAAKTSANFCGVPLPAKGNTPLREAGILARWGARMTVEIICRYLFVSADGPNHDLHHLDARGDWSNHASMREAMVRQYARRGIYLTESWGFWHTLRSHLDAMAEPRTYQAQTRYSELYDLFNNPDGRGPTTLDADRPEKRFVRRRA
jgi:hypothetical protein